MRILAISGSLRAASLNTEVLRFAARAAAPDFTIDLCRILHRLPHFNPDLDTTPGPAAVEEFRAALNSADAIVICSPEYAHGVPGSLKNALDWLVGSGELVGKPVALWNISVRATHAHESIVETLRTMSAVVLSQAFPMSPARALTNEIARDAQLSAFVNQALAELAAAVRLRDPQLLPLI